MKTNIEKTIAAILFSGLLISLGACIGVLVTENYHLKQPLEFREVSNTSDFLYYDLWINSTAGQEWDPFWYCEYNSQLKEFIIKIYDGIIINITLLCMEEGYFIKYPNNDFLETIPYGFNSSYLNLHTSLAFSDVNLSELIIKNISFWQVIK